MQHRERGRWSVISGQRSVVGWVMRIGVFIRNFVPQHNKTLRNKASMFSKVLSVRKELITNQ